MNYCKTCLYPSKTVNLNFHKSEMCSACLAHEKYNKISEFAKKCGGGFQTARRKNWIDEICSHMPRKYRSPQLK